MRVKVLIKFCILLTLSLNAVLSAKIIFLFTGGNLSHKTNIWPLVIGLAERGHHVTFLSPSATCPQTHPNVTDVAPNALAKATSSVYDLDRFQARENGEEFAMLHGFAAASLATCDQLLNSRGDSLLTGIIENLKDFDLAIVDVIFGDCGTLLAEHYGIKHIAFSPTTVLPWFHRIYGIPWQASWISDMAQKLTYPLGFFQRIQNFYGYLHFGEREPSFIEALENLIKERFGLSSVPSFTSMERKSSFVFVNIHPTIDYARPLPPNFISIGGMQCWDSVGELPKDFQDFMDNAEDGVVLIAFGSTVDLSTISTHYLNMFFNMMRKFNTVRFIWRWKGSMPENSPLNLMAKEWLPQKAILNHRNIRAFMTHCGLNSVTEATCFGVPIVGVPLFADQDYTVYRLEAQEIGVKLEVKGITQESMDTAIHKILSNSKYKTNMMSRSKMLKDQPLKPVDVAIFWTEFALRHNDTSIFKPMNLDQSWFVRHMFDVYLALLLLLIVLPLALMYMIVVFIKKWM